jgi:ribosomal protein S18 acetylase RimI-like enzyme
MSVSPNKSPGTYVVTQTHLATVAVMPEDAIRTAGPDDLDAVVDVLTAAFHNDPVMTWAFPDAAIRPRRLGGLWTFMAGVGYLPRGGSTLVPGGDAAALWMAPGDGLNSEFWSANARRFVALLDGDVARLGSMSEQMDANHPHDRDHWYLMAIGVSPAAQGRRLGSALLAHTLAAADAAEAPAYLEASSARSRALYERFGFEVLAEMRAPDGPPMWGMWRQPGAGRGD